MYTKKTIIQLGMLIVALCFLLIKTISVSAAPLEDVPVTVTQPDGTVLNLFVSGDEFYNWLHDADGYTVIQDHTNGYYVYANLVDGKLVPTKLIVGEINPSLSGLSPYLNVSPDVREETRQSFLDLTQQETDLPDNAPTSGAITNLAIFIRFSDESEFTDASSTYTDMLNDSTNGANSLRNYYQEVSYNTLTITSTLLPTPGTTIVSYQDSHTRGYFQPYDATTNPDGYQGGDDGTERADREHDLLRAAINYVNDLGQFPSGNVIDADNDGIVDSVTFIVSGSPTGWSSLLWPHKWNLPTSPATTINGKTVSEYSFQLQLVVNIGVLAHEMFHVLGAPDLYHYTDNGIQPVGVWDVMEANMNPPQHMGCYMKFRYGHWVGNIPEITSYGTTYTINPLTSPTNNCYKIKSPESSTEYFVVEYRSGTDSIFESSLPGDGLLVYRINTTVDGQGNRNGPPDEVYIYRPGGTTVANGIVNNAYFSDDIGRTVLNKHTDPNSFLSDGSAGRVGISNIGTAGETISFTLGFLDIQSPTQTSPGYAGNYIDPTKITIQVEADPNLPKSAFSVMIGDQNASVVVAQEGSELYTLEVIPPTQSSNGLYDLQVTVGNALTDKEVNAVKYADANNVDVDLVIDRSGSMSGTPMTAAMDASKQFIDFMHSGDMIGVVSFDDIIETNFPLTTIQPPSSIPPIFNDDMETGAGKWIATVPWTCTTGAAHSGSYFWTDSLGGNYANYMNIALQTSSTINIPVSMTTPVLTFWQKYALETGYDFGYVEVSTNGGTTWTTLTYSTGTNLTWHKIEVNLTSYSGQNILIRFRLYTDYSVTYDGWYIDDVSIGESIFDTKTAAKSAIDTLYARGNTSIGGGLQRGQEQVTTLGNTEHPWAMVLLSDGWENTAPWVADVLPAVKESKTVVHTIGLGGADEALLMDIASQTGGSYSYAPSPDQLSDIYNTIVGAVADRQTLFVATGVAQQGVTDQHNVVIDSTISEATFSVNWSNNSNTIYLTLRKPDGTIITPATAGSDPNVVYVAGPTYKYYRIRKPTLVTGTWQLRVTGGSISATLDKGAIATASGEPYTARVTAVTNLTMRSFLGQNNYLTDQPVKMIVTLSDAQPIVGASVTASVEAPSQTVASIRAGTWIESNGDTIPDLAGALETEASDLITSGAANIQLFDDGLHGDGDANDGVYANEFVDTYIVGTYIFRFSSSGISNSGDTFSRQSQITSYIAQSSIPHVSSIKRASANPTNAGSVDFILTFSEPVTGVNTTAPYNDFTLYTTGVTGAAITGVGGYGTTYTVTVNTGSGIGTIRLDILDDNSIIDGSSNPLGGVGVGDGDFTAGEVYEIVEAAVYILDTWTADGDWNSKTSFVPYDAIKWIIPVENTTGGSAQVELSYTVKDPCNVVIASWQGPITTASGAQWWGLPGTIPNINGTYAFTGSVTYQGAITEKTTTYTVAGTDPTCVTIGGDPVGSYALQPDTSQVLKYAVDGGPVKISGPTGSKIIASLNQWRKRVGTTYWTGVAQYMGLPVEKVSNRYVIPRYDYTVPLQLYNAILVANLDGEARDVTITIGGTAVNETFSVGASSSVLKTYSGIAGGPVVVSSDTGAKIIASLYELRRNPTLAGWNGQSEMMGLPWEQLSDQYIIPQYFGALNPSTLDARLFIGVP